MNRNQIIINEYQAGKSLRELAKIHSVSYETIRLIIIKSGQKLRKRGNKFKEIVNLGDLINRYTNDRTISLKQLAEENGFIYGSLRRRFNRLGIDTSNRSQRIRHQNFLRRMKPVYTDYINGFTAKDLIIKYNYFKNIDTFYVAMDRYRKYNNLPTKRNN